ncbi:M14 family metallopeptidase [Rhodoferax mekongensis]|uniref:M14-type cytosolic carboxypeptidase n=1 Tax=Rhodoferax mekongensis TaxID=3068341 RepID=A0ABZ0B2D6_9BURK|nr:M14-type cytosolic carboxypeptidase [Rhodoferax sp. TBRC 17307]WNO05780.1 M14-type cytosolic carboxypeptidase [Rhodoferax sp. TBRC 17307]
MNPLSISSQFDSGAIEVLRLDVAHDIQLRIRQDTAAEFAQWFHFCLHGAAGEPVTLRFMNAKQCAYPKGWEGYQVVCSEDRQHWSRIETSYDGEVMTARITPQTNAIYFAYFEPYSYEQHLDLLASAAASSLVTVERLGTTVQGRDMSVLRVADVHSLVAEEDKKDVWVIARQHPGETMAEWFVEGFLERLLDADDSVSRTLLQRCNFHVVPNMNPDGAVLGNLRTNAAGANLNREWAAPSMERSPEVALVRQAMEATGVDLCLDVHGDEALPCNFVVGSEGTPGYTPRIAELEDDFKTDWMRACPDFQDTLNYGRVAAGQANMSLATNWIAQRFGCMALTIEMPFKDNVNLPDPTTGWSGQRSKKLGASVLQPLLQWSV